MSISAPRRYIIECASPTSPRKSCYTPTSPVLCGVTKCQRAEIQHFSILISHRTGPISITQPTQVAAHLVSIKNIDQLQFRVTDGLVGMCSLDSWLYTCLPPNSLNVPDAFRHLGQT